MCRESSYCVGVRAYVMAVMETHLFLSTTSSSAFCLQLLQVPIKGIQLAHDIPQLSFLHVTYHVVECGLCNVW